MAQQQQAQSPQAAANLAWMSGGYPKQLGPSSTPYSSGWYPGEYSSGYWS